VATGSPVGGDGLVSTIMEFPRYRRARRTFDPTLPLPSLVPSKALHLFSWIRCTRRGSRPPAGLLMLPAVCGAVQK
jgi:hypothetical protein